MKHGVSVLICFVCLLALGTAMPSTQDELAHTRLAERLLADTLKGDFGLSLETRENVDFLLSPAIIVQGILTPEIIVTYPQD